MHGRRIHCRITRIQTFQPNFIVTTLELGLIELQRKALE